MWSYRSPASFDRRFGRAEDGDGFAVQSWLQHHGDALVRRFDTLRESDPLSAFMALLASGIVLVVFVIALARNC